jgi:cytochrome c biogenesis protein CcmG/thiol:disulfide interchange protein DsbE
MLKKIFALTICIIVISTPIFAANKAPDFTLKKLSGGNFNLKENLSNGPILIDFWATWCKPCLRALPEIQRIHDKYSEKGLQVITITTDNAKSKSKVIPFVKGARYTFEVLLDTDQEVRKLFGGSVIPLSVLIGSDGKILYHHIGYKPGDEKILEEEILKVLAPTPKEEEKN